MPTTDPPDPEPETYVVRVCRRGSKGKARIAGTPGQAERPLDAPEVAPAHAAQEQLLQADVKTTWRQAHELNAHAAPSATSSE